MLWRKKTAGRWLLYLGLVGGASAFCTGLIGCLWKESVMKYIGLGALVAGFVFLFLWAGEQIIKAFFSPGREELVRADIRNHTKKRLLEAAASFEVLSGVFDGVTDENGEDFQRFAVTLPEVICSDCAKCRECWEEHPEERFAAAYAMYEEARCGEVPGYAEVEYRLDGCLRAERVRDEYALLPHKEQANRYVRRRAEEGRAAVVTQLKVVSDLLKEYSDELYDTTLGDGTMEEEIAEVLRHNGVYAEQIAVMKRKGKGLCVRMQAHCKNGQCIPVRRVIQSLGIMFGCPMVAGAESERFISEEVADFVFEEEPGYMILTGVARATKKDETLSGDSFSFLYPESGETVLLLSDGMGSGYEALKSSSITASLLKNLLLSGVDEHLAIKMTGDALGKLCGECFSTVDLMRLNLINGRTEVTKSYAPASYVIRNGSVYCCDSSSLPLGINTDSSPYETDFLLGEGDTVIMVSDGIAEKPDDQTKITDLLGLLCDVTPKELADRIVAHALEVRGRSDDMSAIVIRLKKAV